MPNDLHHAYQCAICKESFAYIHHVLMHVSERHPSAVPRENVEENECHIWLAEESVGHQDAAELLGGPMTSPPDAPKDRPRRTQFRVIERRCIETASFYNTLDGSLAYTSKTWHIKVAFVDGMFLGTCFEMKWPSDEPPLLGALIDDTYGHDKCIHSELLTDSCPECARSSLVCDGEPPEGFSS